MISIVIGTLIATICSMRIPIVVANIISIVGRFSMRRASSLNVNKVTSVSEIVTQQYNTFSKASKFDVKSFECGTLNWTRFKVFKLLVFKL
jgi:hypothetical protein